MKKVNKYITWALHPIYWRWFLI